MKRLHYFLFAIVLFMSFTTGVEAEATRCKYTWNDTEILLSTDDGGSTLKHIEASDEENWTIYGSATGGISLNRSACPKIIVGKKNHTVYPTGNIDGTNKNVCETVFTGNEDENCTSEISGVKETSGASDDSVLDRGYQFDLVGESGDTCNYRLEDYEINVDLKITKNGDSLRKTCTSDPRTDTCQADLSNDVRNAILNNGNFTCPPYLYASSIKKVGIKTTIVRLTGVGNENDEDRSNGSSWQRPNAISGENWDQTVDCPAIFSEEPGSVGDILRTILGYIRVIGPILVVLLSAIDFIKAIFGFDEKAMGNAYRKLIIRLIAAIALFLIPTLIDVMLDFINATTCTLE